MEEFTLGDLLTTLFRGFIALVCVLVCTPVGYIFYIIVLKIFQVTESKSFDAGYKVGLEDALVRSDEEIKELLRKL